MALRSLRERVIQTCAYETLGLVFAAPLYALAFDRSPGESVLLLAVLTVAEAAWSPIHDTIFDRVEFRSVGRLASDRPHRWRLVHAASHELSSIVVTLPMIMAVGGYGAGEALAVDLMLSAIYAAYAYGFHLGFDRLRPVRPRLAEAASHLSARAEV